MKISKWLVACGAIVLGGLAGGGWLPGLRKIIMWN